MSLLNKNGHYRLRTPYPIPFVSPDLLTCKKELSTESVLYRAKNWENKDYYYIEIFNGLAFDIFPIDTIIPSDILEKIKSDDQTFLYLFNTHEAFLDIGEPLYKSLVINNGIPPKKIYIGTNSPDLHKEIKTYADENSLEYMNVEWVLEFEHIIGHLSVVLKFDGSTILTKKPYDKKYLNFNRRWRPHRPIFVALLKAKNLLDKGYVSLAHSDDNRNWQKVWSRILDIVKEDEEITNLILKYENEIKTLPNLYLDTKELVTNQGEIDKNSLYLYENSLVSLVSETNFLQNNNKKKPLKIHDSRFLSEKIFKPIAVGHPFIYIAPPNCLELLRSLGYKTFHPYIDESYDLEINDLERIKKIIKEVERISNFNDEQSREFCSNVKEICNYNQELMKKRYLSNQYDTYIKKML